MLMEGPTIPRTELSTVHLYQLIHCLCTINCSTLDVGIIASVCVACATPHLHLKFEFRPSWNNIHDTFPTGTPRRIQQHDLLIKISNVLILVFYLPEDCHMLAAIVCVR